MRKKHLKIFGVLFMLAALTLAACGGGGGGGSQEDGSIERPYTLTDGTGHDEQVDAWGAVYHKFTTDSAGGTYVITLSSRTTNVNWGLYSNSDYLTNLYSCSDFLSSGDLTCITQNLDASTTYYIEVYEGSGSAGTYTITVQKGNSEGSINTPVALTVGTSRSSGADALRNSYYKFTTGSAGIYTITMDNSTSVYVYVYSDPSFTTLVTSTSLAAGTTYYVKTYNPSTDVTYNITVSQFTGTTYTSTDVPKSIPDADTITGASSTISVSGGPTSITKVRVTLSITHTYDADLDIYLVAPDGTQIMLSTDNGGSLNNYTNTTFDGGAGTFITSGTAPFTGTYRPEGALSGLNGKDSNGTWTLRVYDDASFDTGTLTAWSIGIQ